jgi:hypothetical protein
MHVSRSVRLPLTLAACLLVDWGWFSTAACGEDGAKPGKDDAGAKAAFLEAYKVFAHPRCVNCHPVGDSPLRGDSSEPHSYLRRGLDGSGVFAARCTNCHQTSNQPGEHSPPGAPQAAKEVEKQNEPRWHMPPAATPMVFEKRTPTQLCRQLLDIKRNGNLTPGQLVDHVSHDPFVLWGWNPGEGRSKPPLSHEEFVRNVKVWVDKGCACPK